MALSPREYSDMLTESHRRAKTPFSESQITSWIEELQSVFPDLPEKVCVMYIELHTKKKKKRKKRKKRKSNIKQREFIVIKTPEPLPEGNLTEEEKKVKDFVLEWFEYWDYEKHAITHPYTVIFKVDMEFKFGIEKSLSIIKKLQEECKIFDLVKDNGL